MALRIGGPMGQMNAASPPTAPAAAMPPEEQAITPEALQAPVEEPMGMEGGSAVEWLQEAMDLCRGTPHSEDLAYALEQALIHLVGPSAVGATESIGPEPVETEPEAPSAPAEPPAEEEEL